MKKYQIIIFFVFMVLFLFSTNVIAFGENDGNDVYTDSDGDALELENGQNDETGTSDDDVYSNSSNDPVIEVVIDDTYLLEILESIQKLLESEELSEFQLSQLEFSTLFYEQLQENSFDVFFDILQLLYDMREERDIQIEKILDSIAVQIDLITKKLELFELLHQSQLEKYELFSEFAETSLELAVEDNLNITIISLSIVLLFGGLIAIVFVMKWSPTND